MYAQAASSCTTLRDVLRFAVSRFNDAALFYGHGTQNSYDEAVYLVLSALKLPIDQLEPFFDAKLLPIEVRAVIGLIERRVEERVPTAYLTNEAWQGDFNYYVDERVLVPRSFIYELLGEPLQLWIEQPGLVHRALDLCTGSGCLAIQLAHYYPDAQVDAVDISLDALEVAAINVQRYCLEERVKLTQSDMFENIENKYDLIISNPPYVDADSVDVLPPEYLHEPSLALCSGADGLDAIRKILTRAAEFLHEKGVLLVEVGHNRDVLEEYFPTLPFMWMSTESGDGFVFLITREDLLGGLTTGA